MSKMAAFSGFLLVAVLSLTISAPVDNRLQALSDTLSAIERLVRYYKSTFRELNIDGLFGLRVLEGQLGLMLERFHKGESGGFSKDIGGRIHQLKQEATSISEEAVSFVKRGDEEYYKDLHFVVSRPWILWKSQRVLNFSSLWSHDAYFNNKKKLTESESDHCMTQLTGTLGKGVSAMCQIKEDCVELMTTRGLTGYGITHQILWSMLSEQAGCLKNMKTLFEKRGRSVDDFQTEFCTNNFLEMIQTVHIILRENITPRFQDLFLEQQFVCPNIGFYEFLSSSYLYEIIHWQKENGCFGSMPRTANLKDNDLDYDYEEDTGKENNSVQLQKHNLHNDSQSAVVVQKGQKLIQQFSNQDSQKVKPQDILTKPLQRGLLSYPDLRTFKSRKLMVEKAMSGGCLAHKTAVGAGALVMYLKYLVYPGSSDIFKNNAFIKSKLSATKPLTDNEDVAYALAMGQTFKDMPKAILDKTAVKKEDQSVKANRTLLKKDYSQPGALNNNVLAAQLYGKTDKEEYYSNQKEKEEYYDEKNESPEYPKKDAKKTNQDVRMVHFDNGKDNKKNYLDEDYKDDDYNDKGDVKEEEEKNEDRDYPYYDVNQRKQQEEADRIEREDKDQYVIKRDKGGQPDPAGGEGEKVAAPSQPDGPSLGTVMLGFSAVFCVLLFFVYRFIRSRRVHIHYSLRSLMRRM